MNSKTVRNTFSQYFQSQNHKYIDSSSLVPHNDPTLLFTNAGMNQFKDVFLGTDKRDYSRAVSVQKCVRAGGKHNDLENVGYTTRHHTFFEMLGNFSFGDYFKKDAIHFAWELLTKKYNMPKDLLYVTVFDDDDEAEEIWIKQEGVPKERILRYGESDNFWRMGNSGPCGPCSEIFFDLGVKANKQGQDLPFGKDEHRYVEIWNLVFMQFFENEKGEKSKLPRPSVDTGSGLERMCTVLQGVTDNFETDLFTPIINATAKKSGTQFVKSSELNLKDQKQVGINTALKVMADHARATSFLMTDGVVPSNEGRGYVLRRIMRRAIRYGRNLSTHDDLFLTTCLAVIQEMSEAYPDIKKNEKLIAQLVTEETRRFTLTLDAGTELLQNYMRSQTSHKVDGLTAFKLYDTFGFPLDLTQVIARENNFTVDLEGFDKQMESARDKAKKAHKTKNITENTMHMAEWTSSVRKNSGTTEFTGYTDLLGKSKVLSISSGSTELRSLKAGDQGFFITASTPFYAEGGGQVGDSGTAKTEKAQIHILDCQKYNDVFVHACEVLSGQLHTGDEIKLEVSVEARQATANNHSATHLLHSALRKVLGNHVGQAGSLVNTDKLRFDFKNNSPMTLEQILEVENLVNTEIAKNNSVSSEVLSYPKALEKGAIAMFGEKYGDQVRVVGMGDFSMELCGGTHVHSTANILALHILSESGVSAGVRRIEAITGLTAVNYLRQNTYQNLSTRKKLGLANQTPQAVITLENPEVNSILDDRNKEIQNLKNEIHKLSLGQIDLDQFLSRGKNIHFKNESALLVIEEVAQNDRKVLSEICDKLRDKNQKTIVALLGPEESGGRAFLLAIGKELKSLNAGAIYKELSSALNGKGGGRADFAQGSVQSPEALKILKDFFR